MFMRENSKCAHQLRPPLAPGVSGRSEEVTGREAVHLPTVELTRRSVSEGAGSDHA